LYELCSKRNWSSPKFVFISNHNITSSISNNNVANTSGSTSQTDIGGADQKQIKDTTTITAPVTNNITTESTKDDIIIEKVEENKKLGDDSGGNKNSSVDAKSNNSTVNLITTSESNSKRNSSQSNSSKQQQENNNQQTSSNNNPNNPTSTIGTTSSSASGCIDFIISVYINGRELGRGRGGSKKSAQQDAARKALYVLFPGVMFDPNGVLVDLGIDDVGLSDGSGGGRYSCEEEDVHLTNLASRLAIDGEEASLTPSEDSSISTTMSMKKNIVTPLLTGGPLRPHLSTVGVSGQTIRSSIYPCASTTSASSATSEDDDDEYFSSRGAHICSVLLHAMVQIDERIREPPRYKYDVCETTMAASQKQQPKGKNSTKRKEGGSGGGAIASKRRSATTAIGRVVTIHRCSFACTASLTLYKEVSKNHGQEDLKKDENDEELKSGQGKQILKQEKGGGNSKQEAKGKELSEGIGDEGECEEKKHGSNDSNERLSKSYDTPHVKSKHITTKEDMNTPIDVEKEDVSNNHQCVKATDISKERETNVSQETTGRKGIEAPDQIAIKGSEEKLQDSCEKSEQQAKPFISTKLKARRKLDNIGNNADDGIIQPLKKTMREENVEMEQIDAVATGASKRDAKHIASAKLLALIFPDCDGQVEVVKAAEAAREKYAANKALKQSIKATNFAYTKRKKIKYSDRNHDKLAKVGNSSIDFELKMNEGATPLQSVKEEEGEDTHEQASTCSVDQLCHKRLKLK
jgi:hypothetical protein